MKVKTMKVMRPMSSRAVQNARGATTLWLWAFAMMGDIHMTANTPMRAMAISMPMASESSWPSNHLAMALETVVPAISHPHPKIMKPRDAILALPGRATHQLSSQPQKAVVWNQSEMPMYLMIAPPTMRDADRVPVKRTPILSRMMPAMMRNPQTLRMYSDAA